MFAKFKKIIPTIETTEKLLLVIDFHHKLRFDGASKGNPGLSGAGAVIYEQDKEIWAESHFIGNDRTNNEAEYIGLILGLRKAIELNIKELLVEGDSMLIIKQMTGEYKVASERLEPLHKTAKSLETQFDKIVFKHIYRNDNKRADDLANISIKMNETFFIQKKKTTSSFFSDTLDSL